jgi:hypothetical protein
MRQLRVQHDLEIHKIDLRDQPCRNHDEELILQFWVCLTSSVVQWSEFLAADPEVPDSILGAVRFSE